MYPQQAHSTIGEQDPMLKAENGEVQNPYYNAGFENMDVEFNNNPADQPNLAALQEAQFNSQLTKLPDAPGEAFSSVSREGDPVESIEAGKSSSRMNSKLFADMQANGPAGVQLEGMTAGMSLTEIEADAFNHRFQAGDLLSGTIDSRTRNIDGDPVDTDGTNYSQNTVRYTEYSAAQSNAAAAAAKRLANEVAAGKNGIDISSVEQQIADSNSLNNMRQSEAARANNTDAVKFSNSMGEQIERQNAETAESLTQIRALQEEREKALEAIAAVKAEKGITDDSLREDEIKLGQYTAPEDGGDIHQRIEAARSQVEKLAQRADRERQNASKSQKSNSISRMSNSNVSPDSEWLKAI